MPGSIFGMQNTEPQTPQNSQDTPPENAQPAPPPDASARTMLMPAPEFSNAYRGVPVGPDEELFVPQNRVGDAGALTQMMAAPTAIMTAPGFAAPDATQILPAPIINGDENAPAVPANGPAEAVNARANEPVAVPVNTAKDSKPDVPIVPMQPNGRDGAQFAGVPAPQIAALAPEPDSPFGGS